MLNDLTWHDFCLIINMLYEYIHTIELNFNGYIG